MEVGPFKSKSPILHLLKLATIIKNYQFVERNLKKNALIIFSKAPRPGTVKTRMQPELSPDQSRTLYMAMVEDLTATFANADSFNLLIHYWPTDAGPEMEHWLGADKHFTPQHEGNLGAKMHLAFADVLNSGYEKVAIIGSDLPSLNENDIESAYQLLDAHDAVFGPTDDGGYYLVALKNAQPVLFESVEWSTPAVFEQTLANAQRANLSVGQLIEKRDIDNIEEVQRLWASIRENGDGSIPRTAAVLRTFFS